MCVALLGWLVLGWSVPAGAEVILQYFGTSWPEITRRLPELAEAGYNALWLPPPFKAGAGGSVGFDCYDRFDVGNKNQNGSTTTRYGTGAELINLVETSHRFGIRVYFDNIMAHNGGPWPSGAPGTLNANGFVPEDFHLIRTGESTYTKVDWPTWTDEWQVLNRNPFGYDIAQETPNDSFGYSEGDDYAKWSGLRHPGNPEYYPDADLTVAYNNAGEPLHPFADCELFTDTGYGTNAVGAANGRFDWQDANANGQHDPGETCEPFTDTGVDPGRPDHCTTNWGYADGKYNMGNTYAEDVNAMLYRAVRWFVDKFRPDGFRLDAVKHVPAYFFGKMDDPKDDSNWGYCGQIQEQYNLSRGYSDWNNHRDTVFNNTQARDDLLCFGEHLGEPPARSGYVSAGLRTATDDFLNAVKNNVGATLSGMDSSFYNVTSPSVSMMYVMSHDNNILWGGDRMQAHAMMVPREGLPMVYTDGYNESTEAESWFPKPADVPFLGQFNQGYLPNLCDIAQHFGWGYQSGKWSDQDFCAFSRYDPTATGTEGEQITMIFMMARNYVGGWIGRDFSAGFPEGARLVNYSVCGGPFYVQVSGGLLRHLDGSQVTVPSGEYYVFSWRNPEMPPVWGDSPTNPVRPIMILEDGQPVGTIAHTRRDGRDGDPAFNPYGLADSVTNDFAYTLPIPRITRGSNLTIVARADGSAENILLKFDGGVDLNSRMSVVSQAAGTRDNPPAAADDRFLGYEQMRYIQRACEKFAAVDVGRNVIGSPGAETYRAVIGSNGYQWVNGGGVNASAGTVTWIYHEGTNTGAGATRQFNPLPAAAAGQPVELWAKIGYQGQADRALVYYTTNGANPEGSAGTGLGATRVAAMQWVTNVPHDGTGVADWWRATLPPMPAGVELRYKISAFDDNAPSVFPWSADNIAVKQRMETQFDITNFNVHAAVYYPHNDWGAQAQGLADGYHVLRMRAFLGRAAGHAPIYRQWTQTIYLDTEPPRGAIIWPAADHALLRSNTYVVVVHTDPTVTGVWYRVDDLRAANNGAGNGAWAPAATAQLGLPPAGSPWRQEWRFTYTDVATNGSASLQVRLLESTSSTNMNLSDAAGHFRTLQRNVDCRTNGLRLWVAQPVTNGAPVAAGDLLRVQFSKPLADGLTSQQVIQALGVWAGDTLLTNTGAALRYNVSTTNHEFTLPLPDLALGTPDVARELQVIFTRTNAPLMTARRSVVARTADSNGDGVPDDWEAKWGQPAGSLAAGDDDDGDGADNLQEYYMDTHPLQAGDVLMAGPLAWSNGRPTFNFQGKSNRLYHVWYRDTLFAGPAAWQRATASNEPMAGDNLEELFTDQLPLAAVTQRYYRLQVLLP